jgi:Ala-tRNA(Pro) deacylase
MAVPGVVREYLAHHHVPYTVVHHPLAYTAQEGAAATHVPGREWAKAVVCMADDQPVLAVLPAHREVHLELLRYCVGSRSLRLARETEIAPLYGECELGAMPPFGPLFGQRVFVDKSLVADPEIVFNAGSHRDAIRMRYADFERLVHPTVAEFGIPSTTVA